MAAQKLMLELQQQQKIQQPRASSPALPAGKANGGGGGGGGDSGGGGDGVKTDIPAGSDDATATKEREGGRGGARQGGAIDERDTLEDGGGVGAGGGVGGGGGRGGGGSAAEATAALPDFVVEASLGGALTPQKQHQQHQPEACTHPPQPPALTPSQQ